ncbi:hypothetical protein EYS09_17590 [Streptomyces kasugaensis]|uniref:Uncharacterized protein n=1 Tax=Streptomyces kasugaensis TaxID=1946 RepID=A0A4Q9HV86_STRKA|nr:hypothetical protein [Streptomyces kasugaensis]TBO58409.1 hypothetical protein EYS09_17590 [Streptomyces kasugaensis]
MTGQQAEVPVAQGIDSSTRHGRDSSAMMSVFADPHREFALAATNDGLAATNDGLAATNDGLAAARGRGKSGGRLGALTGSTLASEV